MGGVIITDATIIGAGPCGLHAAFHLGMLKVRCHIIDSLDRAGGQCAALYPEKILYDIPGFSRINGLELAQRLEAQSQAVQPAFHFGETVEDVQRSDSGLFLVKTARGLLVQSRVVVLAIGNGALHPRSNGSHVLRENPAEICGAVLFDGAVKVHPTTCETSVNGMFALGDVANYAGKLKYIISGFHEAALMAQRVFAVLNEKAGQS